MQTYHNQHHSDINQLLINQYNPIQSIDVLSMLKICSKSIQWFSIELRETHCQQININIYDIMPFAISFSHKCWVIKFNTIIVINEICGQSRVITQTMHNVHRKHRIHNLNEKWYSERKFGVSFYFQCHFHWFIGRTNNLNWVVIQQAKHIVQKTKNK